MVSKHFKTNISLGVSGKEVFSNKKVKENVFKCLLQSLKSRKELEIQTLVCYKVSFYLSDEASFWSCSIGSGWEKQCQSSQSSFHKIAILFGVSKKSQCRLLP